MREYVYRDYLRKPFKAIMWIVIYIVSMFIIGGIISYIKLERKVEQVFFEYYLLALASFIITIMILFFIVYLVYIKKVKSVKYILGVKNLIYKCNGVTKLYAYKDIIGIETSPLMINFGSIKIKFMDANFKITVKIKNSNIFIKELKEKLDSLGMSDKYSEKKLIRCYRNAGYSEDSWGRLHDALLILPPTIGICTILAFICSFLTDELYINLIIVLLLFFYPIIVALFSELWLGFKYIYNVAKESFDIKVRDEDFEKKVYKIIATIVFLILITVITIIIKLN